MLVLAPSSALPTMALVMKEVKVSCVDIPDSIL